jgi:hypothetical protein
VKSCLPLALPWLLFGCAASTGPGVAGATEGCKGADCGRGSTASRGAAGSSTGAASSSSNGTSSAASGGTSSAASSPATSGASGTSTGGATGGTGGSSSGGSGSSGNGICGKTPLPDGGGCPHGAFVSVATDAFTCLPVAGATMDALDPNGIPLSGSATTASDGTFVFCEPPATPFTPSLAATGYSTIYYPELQANVDSSFTYIGMISNSFIGVLEGFGMNPKLGSILVHISNSASCPDQSGWTFTLTYPDGGAIPDGGYSEAYLGASDIPQAGLTATGSGGTAFFSNLDLSTTNYFAIQASNPDAGSTCIPKFVSAFYTGRIYVTANALSIYNFQIPP